RDASVLLVLGAQAAVVRTALVRRRAVRARQAGRLAELVAVVVRDVGADEILDGAVLRTLFAEINAALADNDLRLDEPPALRTEAAGRAKKRVVTKAHTRPPSEADGKAVNERRQRHDEGEHGRAEQCGAWSNRLIMRPCADDHKQHACGHKQQE